MENLSLFWDNFDIEGQHADPQIALEDPQPLITSIPLILERLSIYRTPQEPSHLTRITSVMEEVFDWYLAIFWLH